MIFARELLVGAVGYLIGVIVLRLLPRAFIPSTFDRQALVLAAIFAIGFGSLAYSLARRRPPGQRIASAACIALPVLLGDALEMTHFSLVYPNFQPEAGSTFACLLLFTNLGIVVAGWLAERFQSSRASVAHSAG